MGEIVHVQLGQCGNKVGEQFFKMIMGERGLKPNANYSWDPGMKLENIDVYFTKWRRNPEPKVDRYIPRAILIDLDPDPYPNELTWECGGVFDPENVVCGCKSAGNNWAKGYFSADANLVVQDALEVFRKEAEACNKMQGIQMVSSLVGGTGSGLGSLLMTELKDEYPGKIVKCYSVMHSQNSKVNVEPYNVVLGLCTSIHCADLSVCVDNFALHQICTKVLKITQPKEDHLNHLISACMAGITSCFRIPRQPTTNLGKMVEKMVQFPKLHFVVTGYAPLTLSRARYTVADLVYLLSKKLFYRETALVDCVPSQEKSIATAVIFRSEASRKPKKALSDFQSKNSSFFVEWVASNMKEATCKVGPSKVLMNATLLSNTTAIRDPLKTLVSRYNRLLQRRSHIHSYKQEGMDESEFWEALEEMRDLTDEYQQQNNH